MKMQVLSKIKLKKGDKVVVLSGKDRGKTGLITKIMPKENKLLVQGINLVTRHTKPSRTSQAGGIITKEAPLYVSKVAYYDEKLGASRIGYKILENGEKKRFIKKSGEIIG